MSAPADSTVEASIDALHEYVLDTIGLEPNLWPGGWPDEIEAALIDAVFSVRARYGSRKAKTGVFGAVTRWQEHREGPADDLRVLAATDPGTLRAITNSGKIARRYKAEVVVDAAAALVQAGIVTADDFRDRQPVARPAYLGVKGCGPVTWSYLRMLVGLDDVKPDTWIMRFIHDRIPSASPEAGAGLLKAVARRMDVDAHQLDHAVWAYRRTAKDK